MLNVLVGHAGPPTAGGRSSDVAVPLALRDADPLLGCVEHWDDGTLHRRTGRVPCRSAAAASPTRSAT